MSVTRRVDPEPRDNKQSESTESTRRVEVEAGSETRRVEVEGASEGDTRRVEVAGEGSTRRVAPETGQGAFPLGMLGAGVALLDEYTVERTIAPHERQAPGIYLCRHGEQQVIIKIAATNHPPKQELWSQLCRLQHPHLVRTLVTTERQGRFYEVQEYCSGGSLRVSEETRGTHDAKWVMEVLVPQVCAALEYLHDNGIVHRDIKPDNIYVRGDGSLVVGDFDISSVLDAARTSRDTQRLAGTWVYSAPEAFPRFSEGSRSGLAARVAPAADYYSLGLAIVEILTGTTSLHLCELPDLFDFYLQGGRVALPEGLPERLTMLLRGLLIRNRKIRWGAAEVSRWLAGASSAEDRRRIVEDQTYELTRASQPYRLEDQVALDLPGLAEAMWCCQKSAMSDLMDGDVLLSWIGLIDANVARELRRDRERLRHHPPVALYAAIVRCDPNRPFPLPGGVEVLTREELRDALLTLLQSSDEGPVNEAGDLVNLRRLAEWFRLKADPEADTAQRCAGIVDRTGGKTLAATARTRLEEVLYLLDQARPYLVADGAAADTPRQLARLAYGQASDWTDDEAPPLYRELHEQWRGGHVGAWLRQRGLEATDAQVEAALDRAPQAGYAAFEALLHALDPGLPAVHVALDPAGVEHGVKAAYGQTASVSIAYRTVGPGMPYGAFALAADNPEVQLGEARLVERRSGRLQLTLDGTGEMPVSRSFAAHLTLTAEHAVLQDAPVAVPYKVTMPVARTLLRVALGAMLGAALVGGARFLITFIGHPNPVHAADINAGWVWRSAVKFHFPRAIELVVLVILAGAIYLGWQLWVWAVRKSED